jgi:phospholipase/carboxylesterase
MSIAAGLGSGRPAPALLLAWSGFVPTVDGWELDPAVASDVPVLVTHGSLDPVIPISFGHDSKARLEATGAQVEWREPPMGHELDPRTVLRARELIAERVGAQPA